MAHTFTSTMYGINMHEKQIELLPSREHNTANERICHRGICHAENIHIQYPSILSSYIDLKGLTASDVQSGLHGIFKFSSSRRVCKINVELYHDDINDNYVKSVQLFTKRLPYLLVPGIYNMYHCTVISTCTS